MKGGANRLFIISLVLFLSASMAHADVDNIPPVTPAGLAVSVNPSSQIFISWNAATDNVGVVGYYVYRNGALVINTPGLYSIETVPSGLYFYTVAAYDAAGNVSPQSAPVSITYSQDTIPPSTPGSFSAAVASSSVTLSWSPSTDNVGVIGYYIYVDNIKVTTTSTITSTSYTDSGFASGDLNIYSVAAYDGSGNVSGKSPSITVVFDGTPPFAPLGTSANGVAQNEIDVSWRASTDNFGVAGYYIYRDGTLVGNVSSTVLKYADTGLSPQTRYGYVVAAYDAVKNVSLRNDPVYASTLQQDIYPPSAPGGIIPVSVSSSGIAFSWQPAVDNVGISGYYVYRNGTQTAVSTSTSYTDSGLAASTTYRYAIIAYDAGGNTSPSSSISITTLSTSTASTAAVPATYPAPSNTPTSTSATNKTVFASNLYYGVRSETVKALQLILIGKGYLSQDSATGFFGPLTQKAVQKFQCDYAVTCSGTPQTSGWGYVGPKTRKALNAL